MFFFFIGGVQPKTVTIARQTMSCSVCGHADVYKKRVDQYLSLFFIPLFPVKRGMPFLACENCQTILDEHGARVDARQAGVEMRCSHCGRSVDPDFNYCPYCGRSV